MSSVEFRDCERTEKMSVSVVVDKSKLTADLLSRMKTEANIKAIDQPDTETVTWVQDFYISYYDIVQRLQLVLDLIDISSVAKVSIKELTQQKCLVQDYFCRLEQLEQKYKATGEED